MDKFSELVGNYEDRMWPEFRDFVKKQFHEKYILADKPFFDWQYKDNPYHHHSTAALKILAYHGEILGYLGLIPAELSINGDVVKRAGALCNLMISSSCRVFGLGSYLVKVAMKDFDALWGTGYHPKTGPMYLGLGGWALAGDLNRYVKVLDTKRVGKMIGLDKSDLSSSRSDGRRSQAGIRIKEIKRFDENIESFWRCLSRKYPVTVARTREYLNWRYADHPYFAYRILIAENSEGEMSGYLIFRLAISSGSADEYHIVHVLDLIAEERTEQALISECCKLAVAEKVDLIDYFATGSFHRDSFLNSGFILTDKPPFDQVPIYFNPISLKRSRINFLFYFKGLERYKSILSNSANWYITKGDGDKDRPNPV